MLIVAMMMPLVVACPDVLVAEEMRSGSSSREMDKKANPNSRQRMLQKVLQ